MKKRICGVYKIENLINHKVYIGQSIDIYKRWKAHKISKDNTYIHRAFKKYGINNFSFEILKETQDLDYWEIFLIQIYHSDDYVHGYNMTKGGCLTRSLYPSENQFKSMASQSDRMKSWYKNASKEEIKTLRKNQRIGFEKSRELHRQHTREAWNEDVKYRASETHKKLAQLPNYKNPMKGKHWTEEEKQQKSIKCKQYWNSLTEDERKNILKKRVYTPEERLRRSQRQRGDKNNAKNPKTRIKIRSNMALTKYLYYNIDNPSINFNEFRGVYKNYLDKDTLIIYNNIKEGKYGYKYDEITKKLERYDI